jgi:hypothetical protein
MRLFLFLLIYSLVGWPILRYGDGWMLMVLSLVLGMLIAPPRVFLWGFLAGFLLWIGPAIYIEINAETALSSRVSSIFGLPASSLGALILTGFLGGLIGAFYSWLGKAFLKWFKPPAKQRRHPRYTYSSR